MQMTQDGVTFEQFVRTCRTRLWLKAVSLCGEWHAAEDLVQEVLMIMHRRWQDIEPQARGTYARTVLAHLVMQEHRRARSQHESTEDSMTEPIASSREEEAVVRLVILDALGGLPDRQRNAVYLRYWEGLSTDAIAQALHIPAGTVRSDLTRAAARLRRTLRGSFPRHAPAASG